MNETLKPKVAIGSKFERKWFADRGSDGSYRAKLPAITVDGERLQKAMLSAGRPAPSKRPPVLLIAAWIALFAVSVAAVASDIAYMNNEAGGRVVITDAKCPKNRGGAVAYTYVYSGETQFGCWNLSGMNVMIQWQSGRVYTYPLDAFEPSVGGNSVGSVGTGKKGM